MEGGSLLALTPILMVFGWDEAVRDFLL